MKLGKSSLAWKSLSGLSPTYMVSNHVYIGSDNRKFPTANVDVYCNLSSLVHICMLLKIWDKFSQIIASLMLTH